MHTLRLVSVLLTLLIAGAAEAGLKDTVETSELASLGEDALEGLADVEHQVSTAEIMVAGDEARVRASRDSLSAAKDAMKQAKTDLKAAKEEHKLAKDGTDGDRFGAAIDALAEAEVGLTIVLAEIKWRSVDVSLAKAIVKRSKLMVTLTEAELELARLSLLEEQMHANVASYDKAAFQSQHIKARDAVDKATVTVTRFTQKRDQLAAVWEQVGGVGLDPEPPAVEVPEPATEPVSPKAQN